MIKQIGAVVLMSGLALSASANEFFLDRGVDWAFNPDGDSTTANIQELGYSGTLATSFYFGALGPGTPVIDTNFGMLGVIPNPAPLLYTTIGGPKVPLRGTPLFAQQNIDTINPLTPGVDDTEGYGGSPLGFQFFYQYKLFGAINPTGTGVDFTSGFFNVFMVDNNALGAPLLGGARQVLKVNVTGSNIQLTNLDIFGEVDYSWCAPLCTTETKNLFNDVATGDSFFNLWSRVPPPVISFALDTNVNPPIPTANQLVFRPDCSSVSGAPGPCLVRQTTLDGSATFKVPEPGTLALVGLGVLGLGLRRSKKRV